MSDLAAYRTRILQSLQDTGSAIWSTDAIDEAVRYALHAYNLALPLERTSVISLPGDGREIALDGLDGLMAVTECYWPYDSSASQETWPPNRVRGFFVYRDDARPVLVLNQIDGGMPRAGDELRLWYSASQTIQDLDGASTTTLPDEHETLLVGGAAGQAAMSRALDLIEIAGADLYGTGLMGAWAQRKLNAFTTQLSALGRARARMGTPYGAGWKLDKWDV